jgi:hypothetical protein
VQVFDRYIASGHSVLMHNEPAQYSTAILDHTWQPKSTARLDGRLQCGAIACRRLDFQIVAKAELAMLAPEIRYDWARDLDLPSLSSGTDLSRHRGVELEYARGSGRAIVAAFGFDMDHAYGFYSKLTGKLFDSPQRFELFADSEGSGSRSVKGTRVTTPFQKVGSAMTFLYDYGDEWRFRVEVIGTGQAQPDANYPRIVSKIGKAPPAVPGDIDDE